MMKKFDNTFPKHPTFYFVPKSAQIKQSIKCILISDVNNDVLY